MTKHVVFLLFGACITGCNDDLDNAETFARVQPQTKAEIALVKETLNAVQLVSIRDNVEFCGYIGINGANELQATPPTRGNRGSCRAAEPPIDMELLASYHTHGAFSLDYDSETPSFDDLRADILEGVDGYVATPGGRIWYNDAKSKTANQLCSIGCITKDKSFRLTPDLPVNAQYDLNGLLQREEEDQ